MIENDPEVFISEDDIAKRIQTLAQAITQDYQGSELVVICILKGGFCFCADLIRKIELPLNVEFLAVTAQNDLGISGAGMKVAKDINVSIKGKHVLLVEGIVNSDHRLNQLLKFINSKGPLSLKVATLLFKPANLSEQVHIDYMGFEIDQSFVVGKGLDYLGRYRELSYIGKLNADQ